MLIGDLQFEAESHTYRCGGSVIPGVTSILSRAGMVKLPPATDPRVVRKRVIGKLVHHACQMLDLIGDIDARDFPEDVAGYVKAYRSFLDKSQAEWELVECRVLIQKHGLVAAGTLDRAGLVLRKPYIIDLKTTAQSSPAHGIQLAGYALGIPPPNVRPYEWARAILLLRANGTFKLEHYTDPTDFEVFMSALENPEHEAVKIWKRNHAILEEYEES